MKKYFITIFSVISFASFCFAATGIPDGIRVQNGTMSTNAITTSITIPNGTNGTIMYGGSAVFTNGVTVGNVTNTALTVSSLMATDASKKEKSVTVSSTILFDGTNLSATNIANAQVNASAAIAATKIGNGNVDNTELSLLNNMTALLLSGDVSSTTAGVATLAASGVSANTYGDSTHVAQIAIDAKGRITSASNVAISGGGGGSSDNWVASGTTNSTLPGLASMDSLVATNGGTFGSSSAIGVVGFGDGSGKTFKIAPQTMTSNVWWIPPVAAFSGIPKFVGSLGTNINVTNAVAGTDYSTPTSTDTLQNKTFDSQATGNVLKFLDYKEFVYPHRVDGSGVTVLTNDYTSSLNGLATFSGSNGTNTNYALYRVGLVPADLDTATELVLKDLHFRVSGTDSGQAQFTIAFFQPAESSGYNPSDYTALSTYIAFNKTPSSVAANDEFFVQDVTLTGWGAALTARRSLIIGIARIGGDANNDSWTLTSGSIQYGRTQ